MLIVGNHYLLAHMDVTERLLNTKLYRKIEFFYTGTIKTEANPQTLLHTSFNCYECPIFKECN